MTTRDIIERRDNPAINWVTVDDLRNSGLDDLYVQVVHVYISGIGVNDGFFIAHNFENKVIRMGLIDPNEEAEGAGVQLEEMVLASVEAEHGACVLEKDRLHVKRCSGIVLSQRSVADLIVRYALSPLVSDVGISLSLNYKQFADDNELRRVLESSNLHWRKLHILKEQGGRTFAVPWRENYVQLYEGVGSTWDKGLTGLQGKGFERYFSVQEQLMLTSDLLEGNAPKELGTLLEFGRYEWSCDAWARKGKELTIYRGVSGLRYQEWSAPFTHAQRTYVTPEFKATCSQKVDVPPENGLRQRLSLVELGDDFCQALIGRPLSEIPDYLKEGEQAIRVELPWTEIGLYPIQYHRPLRLLGLIGGSPSVRGIK